MWLEIEYEPVSLFSLKRSSATNSASKSLPCPSPYSVKMALLNAIITFDSIDIAKQNFELIRDLNIRFKLPDHWVVNNCMIKIHKPKRNEFSSKEKAELRNQGYSNEDIRNMENVKKYTNPFQSTVAFREYVFLSNVLKIVVEIKQDNHNIKLLKKWFMHINYFGKKGCFFQFKDAKICKSLPNGYSEIIGERFPAGIMYALDDVVKDNKTKFENMDNYDSTKAKRESKIVVFPYKMTKSNKTFSMFEKIL